MVTPKAPWNSAHARRPVPPSGGRTAGARPREATAGDAVRSRHRAAAVTALRRFVQNRHLGRVVHDHHLGPGEDALHRLQVEPPPRHRRIAAVLGQQARKPVGLTARLVDAQVGLAARAWSTICAASPRAPGTVWLA